MWLNPGETCNGPPGVLVRTEVSDVTLIAGNRTGCHSPAAIISFGEGIITGGDDSEEEAVSSTKSSNFTTRKAAPPPHTALKINK